MNADEISCFVDCMEWEELYISLHGRDYWCRGVEKRSKDGKYAIEVFEVDPDTHEFVRELLDFTGDTPDECMRHFLCDNYWDGKSFYEVASDIEWI